MKQTIEISNWAYILILLLLGASAFASPKVVDTVQYAPQVNVAAINADAISENVIGVGTTNWQELTAVIWNDCPPRRDTALWYIKSIGEKCDTAYKLIYIPAPYGDQFYQQAYQRTIECKVDTAWAKKIEVRLTESQWQKLLELLK